jgi:hypothetical protein
MPQFLGDRKLGYESRFCTENVAVVVVGGSTDGWIGIDDVDNESMVIDGLCKSRRPKSKGDGQGDKMGVSSGEL